MLINGDEFQIFSKIITSMTELEDEFKTIFTSPLLLNKRLYRNEGGIMEMRRHVKSMLKIW